MCELFDFETRKRDYDFFGCHAAVVATEWLAHSLSNQKVVGSNPNYAMEVPYLYKLH